MLISGGSAKSAHARACGSCEPVESTWLRCELRLFMVQVAAITCRRRPHETVSLSARQKPLRCPSPSLMGSIYQVNGERRTSFAVLRDEPARRGIRTRERRPPLRNRKPPCDVARVVVKRVLAPSLDIPSPCLRRRHDAYDCNVKLGAATSTLGKAISTRRRCLLFSRREK